MQELQDVVKMLDEIEKIIQNTIINEENKEYIEKILLKNMKIEAEIYTKYLRSNK